MYGADVHEHVVTVRHLAGPSLITFRTAPHATREELREALPGQPTQLIARRSGEGARPRTCTVTATHPPLQPTTLYIAPEPYSTLLSLVMRLNSTCAAPDRSRSHACFSPPTTSSSREAACATSSWSRSIRSSGSPMRLSYLPPSVLGPSMAYSTGSSPEALHLRALSLRRSVEAPHPWCLATCRLRATRATWRRLESRIAHVHTVGS